LLSEILFPRWRPRPDLRPRGGSATGAALAVRWLGTAAHVVSSGRTTVLIDPYLSRPRLGRMLGRLVPDEKTIARHLPAQVDAILCGHSHFDHLLDAPTIARMTGAPLFGSATTCAFGHAAGLPASQLREVPPGGVKFAVGELAISFIRSLHGRILFGRVPFPGEVAAPPPLPARAWHYRMGGAFGLLIEAPGASLYHNGSADLVDAELAGRRADVLLVGLAGRRATRDYLGRLIGALAPSLIVPTHHDAFFGPLDRGVRLLPGIDLDGFAAEARAHAPAATIVTPDYGEALAVPPADARGAQLVSVS
jgi:L-ascorbate metabolism protein UlaG (beta-lactamase superfamily)